MIKVNDRPKAICYSLFGYGKPRQENSFDFESYIRGFMINVRMNRLLFPGWIIVLQTDQDTYKKFEHLFNNAGIDVHVNDPAPLCLAMLWRMKPVFELAGGRWKYSHVLCRDTDSPPTYREAQAVQYWINRDKAVHAITDSVSHTLPMLGGMIGVRPDYFTERVAQSWDEMISHGNGINFEKKGSDQAFLNKHIYPKFSQHGNDSITQHYFLGMPNTFLTDYRTCSCPSTVGHESHCYNNIEPGGNLSADLKESNSVCGHIGAAGFYSTALFKFLRRYKDQFNDLIELEKYYPKLFYWTQDETFK